MSRRNNPFAQHLGLDPLLQKFERAGGSTHCPPYFSKRRLQCSFRRLRGCMRRRRRSPACVREREKKAIEAKGSSAQREGHGKWTDQQQCPACMRERGQYFWVVHFPCPSFGQTPLSPYPPLSPSPIQEGDTAALYGIETVLSHDEGGRGFFKITG